MEARIRKFMEYKGISPSELADSIDVQRSNVTHVLKGRNKPSFQFIEKMLQIYPELNAKWLVLGTGNMIDSLSAPTTSTITARTLFDQPPVPVSNPVVNSVNSEKPEEVMWEKPIQKIEEKPMVHEASRPEMKDIHIPPVSEKNSTNDNILQDQFFSSEKPIERLVVFFKDQTFKVYNPSR